MSGLPNEKGVAEIVAWLAELDAAETRQVEISALLSRVQPEAARLQERVGELRENIVQKMRAMDVAQSGNFGWEGRVVWFLNQLRRASRDA